jgi:hypothetical protein
MQRPAISGPEYTGLNRMQPSRPEKKAGVPTFA